jgi:hypothetical protein
MLNENIWEGESALLFSLHVEIYREKLLWAIFSENS